MNTEEKLRIILNWCHKFEFVKRSHVGDRVTAIVHTRYLSNTRVNSMNGSYEITCDSEKEAIHGAYLAIHEHVWRKVMRIAPEI